MSNDNRCDDCGEPLMPDGGCINRTFHEQEKTTGPVPPKPLPDHVEVFSQSARLLDGLPYEEKDRVLRALCILFEVKP